MISPTVTIKNETQNELSFTRLIQSDDNPWISNPEIPTDLKIGSSILFLKGNDPVFPVRGSAFTVEFNNSHDNQGSLSFDDPAVGAPTLKGTGPFNYQITSDENNYFVTITSE